MTPWDLFLYVFAVGVALIALVTIPIWIPVVLTVAIVVCLGPFALLACFVVWVRDQVNPPAPAPRFQRGPGFPLEEES